MKTLAEELMAIGLAGIQQIPTDQPPLSEEDVDNYAEEYAETLRKAQARIGYRPYIPKDEGEF